MKILSFLLLFLVFAIRVNSQSTLPLRADTVVIQKIGGNANFKLQDSSRNTTGALLTNIGGGVYTGKKPRINGDTLFIGRDTLLIPAPEDAILNQFSIDQDASFRIDSAGRLRYLDVDSFATFTPISAPPYSEGRVYYDDDDKALTVMDNTSGTSIQLGHENVVQARNNTGSTINDGQVVYITGSVGQNPAIALAQANALATSRIIGVATHDIGNNVTGKVTTYGVVRDINTSSFSPGDALYLSATTPGALVNVQPNAPNFSVFVGYCLTSNPAAGKILVLPQNTVFNSEKLNDSTFRVANDTITITGKNFANTNLTLNGNRSHDANGNSLDISNMSAFTTSTSDIWSGLPQYTLFNITPSTSFPFYFYTATKKADNSADSIANTFSQQSVGTTVLSENQFLGKEARVIVAPNGTASISATDSVRVYGVPHGGSGIDSVYVPGVYSNGMNTLYKAAITAIDQNFAHNNLTFNGNRSHNANGNSFALNNMNGMQLHSIGTVFGRTQYIQLRTLPNNFSFPLTIQYGMLKQDNSADSSTAVTTYRFGDVLTTASTIDTSIRNSYLRVTHANINISPAANLNLKTVPHDGTGIDSIYVPGPIAESGGGDFLGTNPVYKVPISALSSPPGGSSGQLQYNNAGAFGGTAGLVWDNDFTKLTLVSGFNQTVWNAGSIVISSSDNASSPSLFVANSDGDGMQLIANGSGTGQEVLTRFRKGTNEVLIIPGESSVQVSSTSSAVGSSYKATNDNSNSVYLSINGSADSEGEIAKLTTDGGIPLHVTTDRVVIKAVDSLRISATAAASADSVLAINNSQSDGTNKVLKIPISYRKPFSQTATVTVANTTTETTLIGSGVGSLVISPSDWVVGGVYRVRVHGILGTDGSNPGTTNFRLKLGSTTIATTGGIFQGTSVSGRNFEITTDFVCRSTGATGTVMTMGFYQDRNGAGNRMDDSGSGTPTTIDMTTNQTVGFTLQWSQAAAGNTCSVYIVYLERLN